MATDKDILYWKRQRNGFRLNCTKEINKSTPFLASDSDVTNDTIQASLTVLRHYHSKLEKLDADILLHIEGDEEASAEVEGAASYDYDLQQHISALSAKFESTLSAAASERAQSPGVGSSHNSTTGRHLPSVKLPKLNMSKFGGDPLRWAEFWDCFSTTIHDNGDLSEVDKFKYLRSFLFGDALRLMDGYRLTSANYSQAIESVKERFGNSQLAIFSHLEAMLALPPANHDTQQLQSIYDNCEKHIRSLVALGLEESTFGQVFTPIILSKLPVYVKIELHRRNGSNPWELSNLREWLKEEIRARDYSQRTFGGAPTTNNRGNNHPHQQSDQRANQQSHRYTQKPQRLRSSQGFHGTSASLVTHDTPPKLRCGFCEGEHYSDQCTTYTDVDSRKSCMKGRCFVCLSNQHSVKQCPSKRACVHCGKTGHHRSLSYKKFGKPRPHHQDTSLNVSGDANQYSPASVTNSSLLSHGETAILQTAQACVKGNLSTAQARFLFDTGSSRSFITSQLSNKIKARPKGNEVVSVGRFRDDKRQTEQYSIVEFDVMLPGGGKRTITANVTPSISCPIQKLPLDVKQYPILQQLSLAEPLVVGPQLITIDILLGSDYYYDFIDRDRIELQNGLIMLSSKLGYIATGRLSTTTHRDNGVTMMLAPVDVHAESTLHIERYWSLEDIGVKSPATTNDDEDALATFNKSVRFEDGRYQVAFPWKLETKELPENRQLSSGRLRSLLKRIGPQEDVIRKYDDTIKDQLAKGIVEEAPAVPTGEKVHYIPHHCVITPTKVTTKLRVVYDCSAKASQTSPSLNDCLNRGPVILDDLCGLLLKFRIHPIGLVSDIEKAFLQIGLQQADRDVTRFLWVRDIHQPPDGNNLLILRFCRVLIGAVSSPFLLGAVLKHHLKQSTTQAATDIDGCVYVDNIITGKRDVTEAIEFQKGAKMLISEASMNLREWYTNSDTVRDAIKPADRGESSTTKVLGLTWDTFNDTLSCGSFSVQEDAVNTKRLMLKYLAKVFDPCGYFSAVTVTGKLIIQKLWQTKYGWDDKLPDDVSSEWMKCSNDLQLISSHKLPRCYNKAIGGNDVGYGLHCFCDASAKAYAAIVYLVVTTASSVTSDIVFAKSRVAPVKTLSIPRLELMAALIGVRLLSFVRKALGLEIKDQYIWSDSQCVLHWLHKPNINTVFVRNRVSEINRHKEMTFRYVPTDENPADMSSRGCTFDALVKSQLWWHGPQWLTNMRVSWPNNPIPSLGNSRSVAEMENQYVSVNLADGENTESIITVTRFSSLKRLLRVTAWVRRFINNLRTPVKSTGSLTSGELGEAQHYWDRQVQDEHFRDILHGHPGITNNNLVKQLSLFVDNSGLIRCRGRVEVASIPESAKYPILLPKHQHYTNMVLLDCHERLCHAGVPHTLSQVRHRYWVVQGRSQVKQVIKRCYMCKLIHGGPFRYPDPPPLPEIRVNRDKPFSKVGLDYLGPLYIKSSSGEHSKVWVCLFTCAVVRAVHLEVVENLSAYQFAMCFRRFVATYGTPTLVISDNAKQFHSVHRHFDRVWREIQHSSIVQDYSSSQGIGWKFITELSPWMGGFYERMVGVAKTALKKTLDNRCVTLTELQTAVSEISTVVNSRPLVYVDDDPPGLPLTPSHFLGGPNGTMPDIELARENYTPHKVKGNELIELWRRTNKTLDFFWRTWLNQYLLALRERNYPNKQRNTNNVKPSLGDVVVVKDNLPRKHWRVGRIVGLPIGRDGNCRSAAVQLPNRNNINRPLCLLYPLEIGCGVRDETQPQTTRQQPNDQRPRRRAFVKAVQNLAVNSHDSSSDEE